MKNKKLLAFIALVFMGVMAFAETYKIQIKGEVYIKTVDGDMYQLEIDPEDKDKFYEVDEEDTIIVGEKSSVTFTSPKKIIIRAAGAYKVSKVVK